MFLCDCDNFIIRDIEISLDVGIDRLNNPFSAGVYDSKAFSVLIRYDAETVFVKLV